MIAILLALHLALNPFLIDFPPKKELSHEDYAAVQQKLRQISLSPFLDSLYDPYSSSTSLVDFTNRCSKGLRCIMIDEEKGLYPKVSLKKIGAGGKRCIVSYASYNGPYADFLKSLPLHLYLCGFNGYLYTRTGGFPNPTGHEIQYAGVPYCFKIFMMQEAQQLGFETLLWIDSAIQPLADPSALFELIETQGAFFPTFQWVPNLSGYIFPATVDTLTQLTGANVLEAPYTPAMIFGLQMNTEMARSFIKEYTHAVTLGTPFLSCFPEECLFTALLAQPHYTSAWPNRHFPHLLGFHRGSADTPEKIAHYKQEHLLFYLRHH